MVAIQDDYILFTRKVPTVNTLRNASIKCYLASDQEKYRTEYLWNDRNIRQYFDGKFISCEIGSVKYQQNFFEIVIKKLGLPAENILYIDDSQGKLDVAKKVGIQTYLYSSFEEFEKFIKPFIE